MGKILKPLLVVAAIAVNVIPGVGQVLSAAMISSITMAGITAGIGMASQALGLGPKKGQVSGAQQQRTVATIDPATPRKWVFGYTAFATDVRFEDWAGSGQEYFHRVMLAASHKAQQITEIWFDKELAWTAAGGVTGKFAGYLTVDVRNEGSAANVLNLAGTKYGANRRFTGMAYVALRYKVTGNSKKSESPFASGITSKIVIRGYGSPVYDPRLDSTQPGGSGPQRANDQSTWAYNPGQDQGRNPALQLLTYLIGYRINGKLALGRGIPVDRLDVASFMAAANACDEPISLAGGGTEPRYRADGLISEADDPSGVFGQYSATMNSLLRDAAGRLSLTVIKNDLGAPRADFTEADVLNDFEWQQSPSIDQSINEVRGRYTAPGNETLYELLPYPTQRIDSLDGIDRAHPLDLPLVQSHTQAQRLAKQQLQRSQYRGVFRCELGHRGYLVQLGDPVRLTFAALGWQNKLFRVVEHSIRQDGVVPVVLQEEHASIYAWDASELAQVTPATPTVYEWQNNPLIQAVDEAGDTADWPLVTDSQGTRPDDNATVGAPYGTNVNDRPSQVLTSGLDSTASTVASQGSTLASHTYQLGELVVDVDGLVATYGETAAAAASASAAASYASASLQAQQDAEDAQQLAEAAADLSGQRATAAGNSATAASGSASTASGHAASAATQAGVAATSATNAKNQAIRMLPSKPAVLTDFAWNPQVTAGTPEALPDLTGVASAVPDGSEGMVLEHSSIVLAPKGWLPIGTGRSFRGIARARYVSGPSTYAQTGFLLYGSEGQFLQNASPEGRVLTGAYQDFVFEVTSASLLAQNGYAAYVRPYFYHGSGSTLRTSVLRFEDITQEAAAAGSATAAATSASTASTKATEASQSASAASNSATSAGTSAGQASTSAGQASTSASNAAGSASTAASQASLSAESGLAAKNSAADTFPSDFRQGGKFFTHALSAIGDAVPEATDAVLDENGSDASGPFLRVKMTPAMGAGGGVIHLRTRGLWPNVAGRRYRLTVVARPASLPPGGGQMRVVINFYGLGADGSIIYGGHGTAYPIPGFGYYSDLDTFGYRAVALDFEANGGGGAAWITPNAYIYNSAVPGSTAPVDFLTFKAEDVTSQAAASASATAAATSASSASTSSTNAGNSATSASTSANTASTQAGNASNSASAAASSAAAASSSAAAALTSSTLAASVNTGALNVSPNFSNNANASGAPTGWDAYDINQPSGASFTRVAAPNGPGYSMRVVSPAELATYNGQYVQGEFQAGAWYVLEGDFTLNSGTLQRAGFYLGGLAAPADTAIHIPDQKGADGQLIGNGVVGRTYRVRKLVKGVTITGFPIYYMNHWSGFGSLTGAPANDITWHRVAIRPAAPAEVDFHRAQPLEASLSEMAGALASLNGRSESYWQVETNAGSSASAFMAARAVSSLPQMAALSFWSSGIQFTQPRSVFKNGNLSADWNANFASNEVSTSVAYIEATAPPAGYEGGHHMVGITTNPQPTYFNALAFAFYWAAGQWNCYEGGNGQQFNMVASTPYSIPGKATDRVSIEINGSLVIYRLNGRIVRQYSANYGGYQFRLGGSLYSPSFYAFRDLVFAPYGPTSLSTIGIGADEVSIYNPVLGGWRKTISVVAGNVQVDGNLSASAGIFLGSGQLWRVQLAQKSFAVADGDAVSFGADLGGVPKFIFQSDNLAPLNSGETYKLYADSPTATGFTARLKISTPGATTGYSKTVDTVPGSGPTRQIDKGGDPDATNNTYTLTITGTWSGYGSYEGNGGIYQN